MAPGDGMWNPQNHRVEGKSQIGSSVLTNFLKQANKMRASDMGADQCLPGAGHGVGMNYTRAQRCSLKFPDGSGTAW